MKAIYWDDGIAGHEVRLRATFRPNLVDEAKKWREKMVEAAAEADDELMHKYLEGADLTEADIKRGMRKRTIANQIVPMLCGSAFKNKGVQAMLDAVIDYLPSPVDIRRSRASDEDDKEDVRRAADDEPFSALAFKIMTDPFVGQLTFFRVYSGVLELGRHRVQPDQGQARSASAVCCRCTPTSARTSRKSAPATSPRRSA